MKTYSVFDFNRDLADGPYCWPGGYPRYFLMADGESLSFKAAIEEQAIIRDAIIDDAGYEWQVVACDVNWEDGNMYCVHTNEQIECAYPIEESEENE